MTQIKVRGTFQKIKGRHQLVAASSESTELQEAYIPCSNSIGRKATTERTFLVEVTEETLGGETVKTYRVVDVASESKRQQTAPKSASSRNPSRAAPGQSTPIQGVQRPSGATPRVDATFIHPYNFVSLPGDEALESALQDGIFRRGPSAAHDCYDKNLNSGYIDCELTTHTHWFIPDPRKLHEDNRKHKTLGYFSLDAVDSTWNAMAADKDQTNPAIPAGSLRGMVRSMFETITLSCFSIFDSGALDFRIGFSPDHLVSDAPVQAAYVPCRIVECDGESAVVQLLDGRLEDASDLPVVISPALVRAYTNKVKSGDGPDSQWEELGDAASGTPVVAILNWRLNAKGNKYRWRAATKPYALASFSELTDLDDEGRRSCIAKLTDFYGKTFRETKQQSLIFGYLHRTGPNWREKKDERIFFNSPLCCWELH